MSGGSLGEFRDVDTTMASAFTAVRRADGARYGEGLSVVVVAHHTTVNVAHFAYAGASRLGVDDVIRKGSIVGSGATSADAERAARGWFEGA